MPLLSSAATCGLGQESPPKHQEPEAVHPCPSNQISGDGFSSQCHPKEGASVSVLLRSISLCQSSTGWVGVSWERD